VKRVKARIFQSFDPETCKQPSMEGLRDDYPRLLLRNIILAAKMVGNSKDSSINAEVLDEQWMSNSIPVAATIRIKMNKAEKVISIVAGRKRIDSRTIRKISNYSKGGKPKEYEPEVLILLSLNGTTTSVYRELGSLLSSSKPRIVDVKLSELNKESRPYEFRALGCIENLENPENVLKALLYLAGIR